ncbi:MAG: FAD-binding oxidoreductase [Acidobacteria bacterium]|nr:FAD-binding oxidoreductase [Acidobacteriota bacterium]
MVARKVEVLIVGGGVAGLTLAAHLARNGRGEILLLDREDQAGFYASGHNAAIGRSLTGRAAHTALAAEGSRTLAAQGLMETSGGRLLGAEPGGLGSLEEEARSFGVPVDWRSGAGTPALRATEHLWIPGDGVVDVHGLLGVLAARARERGVDLQYRCNLERLRSSGDGFEVETDLGTVQASFLANAAGAWAGDLGRRAGGLPIPLRGLRRHLVWSDIQAVPPGPWSWWVDRPFYLRPESGGTLLCPCDETAVPLPPRGQQPATDPSALEQLHALQEELVPGPDLTVARWWSGLRTFAPDRGFVVGWDPGNPRLFWMAGLGGHGITTALAVGPLAAEAFRARTRTGALDPARFSGGGTPASPGLP